MRRTRSFTRILAIAFGCLGLTVTAVQAQNYPSRPVRMLVPAAPGGNPDILARMLADKLTAALGQPFLVENAAGAGGVVAAELLTKQPPDGHTLMLGDSGALAINPALNPKLGYKVPQDFTLITALVAVPTALVVPPSMPGTMKEFLAAAKAQPGKLAHGSAGNGSIHHLTWAIFAQRAGIELLHVPYRGGTAMVQALMSGEIQAGWSGVPNVQQAVNTGQLKALAVSTSQRLKAMPNVPTVQELGIVDKFDIATVIGLQGPAGMPRDIMAKLQGAVAKALREPDMIERMDRLAMIPAENGTENYQRAVAEEMKSYAEAVKAAGVKSD